jgi:hypothetical protein
MRWRSYLLISVILLLSCAPVFAENISVSSSSEWLTANDRDTAFITVTVKDFYENPIEGLTVDYSVNASPTNIYYGSFSNPTKTDENGVSTATFKSSIIAGKANISVSVTSVNGTFRNYTIVKIDHDTPYSLQYLSYPNNATVGTVQNIIIRMQDKHGNIVDNRNNTEHINFARVTQDESWFWNKSALNFTNISTTLGNNEEGFVNANISLNTTQGETRIRLRYENVMDKTILIERIADGEPWYIYPVRFDPSVPYLPANGNESFVITYKLFDQYMNVMNNKIIELDVAPGGDPWNPNTTTTYEGLAAVEYGPSSRIFQTVLIATSRDNNSVRSELPVEFYDPSPTMLLLSVNPKNLPSLDVNETSKAFITAVVIDSHGRGVSGEHVSFTQSLSTYSPFNANVTAEPYITPSSMTTGLDGYGYISFIPGRFGTDEFRSLTGNCTITGSWNGTHKTVTPIWKNYGYLQVTTWVSDNNLTENELVDVGVEVYADGPAFASKPIDMIFCTDRGASMLWDTYDHGKIGSDDKMRYLYNYSGVILEELIDCGEDKCDRAGVVSFGPGNKSKNWPDKWPGEDETNDDDKDYRNFVYPTPYPDYEDFSTVDTGLEYDFKPLVQNVIESLRPFSDPWKASKHNVPLRYGLYKSINELIGYGGTTTEIRPEAIRAIVVLSDPEWNDWGDPSAGWDGTRVKSENAEERKAPWDLPQGGLSAWTPFRSFGVINATTGRVESKSASNDDSLQNMANYAAEHDIIIYSIAYPKKDVNIEESRERVFRGLADTTGGMYFECRSGTDLKTIFETIGRDLRVRASVNTTAVFNFTNVKLNGSFVSGAETFDYVNNSQSTRTRKWDGDNATLLYDNHRNDTENWTQYQRLEFDLGTLYVHDRWVANFTLLSKKVGTAELFENSYVTSDDEVLSVPQPIIQTGAVRFGDVPSSSLEITYFNVTDSMNAVYTIMYSGTNTVHARLYYRKAGDVQGNIQGDWKQFAARNYQCKDGECNGFTDEALMNKWLLGSGQYMFKIEAWASDAPLDDAFDGPKGIGKRFFIWLR